MTKAAQARVTAWRLKVLRWSQDEPRQVARTCRHFGISRTAFYRWKQRYEAHGETGLGNRPRTPLRSPRATSREVVSKILYLRLHRIPGRHGMSRCRRIKSTSHTKSAGNVTRSHSRAVNSEVADSSPARHPTHFVQRTADSGANFRERASTHSSPVHSR
jgi:transposase-like protein